MTGPAAASASTAESPAEAAIAVGADETLDRLSATLRILQRRRGHRATSDDVLLAFAATRAMPTARRVLDLGTGKGTVALLICRALPTAQIIGVEAFAASHDLALRNAALNGLTHRFDPRLGDLRDPAVLADEAPFDLITGAPPFMPPGTGVLPTDAQRAAGRFELRGGVEHYCATAARHLAADGRAVILMDGQSRDRTLAAVEAATLAVRRVIEVRPRPARPATFCIVEATHPGPAPAEPPVEEQLTMRAPTGEHWSAAYAAARAALDLP